MRESKRAKELLLEQLRKTPIVQIACEKVGLSRVSFYNWKRKDQEFAKQIDEALLEGCSLVNDMAESQLIGAVKEGNIQGIAYWLKHHHPTYKNRIDITAHMEKIESLSPEQEATVKEALRLASIGSDGPEEIILENPPDVPVEQPQNLSTEQQININDNQHEQK